MEANDAEILATLKTILTTLQTMESHLQSLAGFEERMKRQAEAAQQSQQMNDELNYTTMRNP
jgi:hypothetical protein